MQGLGIYCGIPCVRGLGVNCGIVHIELYSKVCASGCENRLDGQKVTMTDLFVAILFGIIDTAAAAFGTRGHDPHLENAAFPGDFGRYVYTLLCILSPSTSRAALRCRLGQVHGLRRRRE